MNIFEAYSIMTGGGKMSLTDYSYYSDPANAASLISQATAKQAEQQPVTPVVQDPVVQEPVVQEPVVQDPVVQDPVVQDPVVSTTRSQQDYIDQYGPTNFKYTTTYGMYYDSEGNLIQDPAAFLAAKRAYDQQRADEASGKTTVEDPVVEDPVVEDPVVEDPVVEDPVVADGSGDDDSAVVAPPSTIPEGFTEEEYTEFTDEFVPLFRSRFNREPNANDIDYHLKYFYGDKTFDDNEKAELGRAADVERTRNLSFSREVTDFFLRTLGRPPSSQELNAYTATYYRPEQNDFSFSQSDMEQELSPQGTLFAERQKKYGLDDYTEGSNTSPGQITRLLTSTTGKSPTAQEKSEAYKFFEDIGGYGSDPRRIKATDVQAYKEQVLTPKQLQKIPINVSVPTSTSLPSNIPTSFLSPAGTTSTIGSDGVPINTRSISDDAIVGGISSLPTGAPTTPPTPVSITPDTDVYSQQYFQDMYAPKEELPVDEPVALAMGGDPRTEGILSARKKQMARARNDIRRIMAQGS